MTYEQALSLLKQGEKVQRGDLILAMENGVTVIPNSILSLPYITQEKEQLATDWRLAE